MCHRLGPVFLVAAAAFPLVHDLRAQQGGGSAPPPNPAIVFAENAIKVMNADGTNVRTVVSKGKNDWVSWPSWSPDGTRLAFVGKLGGVQGIWKVNLDGTGRQLLAPHTGMAHGCPDWSRAPTADGRAKIVFVGEVNYGTPSNPAIDIDVFVVNTDGTGLQNLTNTPSVSENSALWTRQADGLFISWSDATTEGARLTPATASGGGGLQLGPAAEVLPGWYGAFRGSAHFSDRLLFSGGPAANPNYDYLIDAVQVPWAPVQLTPYAPGYGWIAGFSPDDSRIVFLRFGTNQNGICTANVNGTGVVRIRSTGNQPAWRHN
jgi:dipeptidyl aminopeptidase/acylaminoacyl peptidase